MNKELDLSKSKPFQVWDEEMIKLADELAADLKQQRRLYPPLD